MVVVTGVSFVEDRQSLRSSVIVVGQWGRHSPQNLRFFGYQAQVSVCHNGCLVPLGIAPGRMFARSYDPRCNRREGLLRGLVEGRDCRGHVR